MKIAILGGSFDPPHKGHIAIARYLLKFNNFNQVRLMPCYSHPFVKNLSVPSKRLAMTKYLENDNIKVSDFEIGKKTISYSINALKYLTNKYPKNKFSWVIGEDQVKDFTKWKGWKDIHNTWEPAANCKNCPDLIEAYWKSSAGAELSPKVEGDVLGKAKPKSALKVTKEKSKGIHAVSWEDEKL